MNRPARFAMELLLPPIMGASPFLAFALLFGQLEVALGILTFAYLMAGIPSLVFAVILELAFMAGLDPRGEGLVRLASWLGLAAGLAMAAFAGDFTTFILLAPLGIAGGAFTALIIRRWSRPRA
jgi:hypothetical protein